MKETIRPIYCELQGYLSQAPQSNGYIYTERLWIQHNQAIDELEALTSKIYSRYRFIPGTTKLYDNQKLFIESQVYRTVLAGLIARIHGEYFPDEKLPLEK